MISYEYLLIILSLAISMSALITSIMLQKEMRKIKYFLKILKIKHQNTEYVWDKKIRKRYIVFTILCEQKISKHYIEHSMREKFKEYFGENELVKADPQLIYFDPNLQRGIVRTTQKHKEKLLAVFQLIREINGIKCIIIPIRTTGTIKKARKILYRFEREYNK